MGADIEEIIFTVFLFLVICVPVLGITARFALKPIVEAMLQLREAFSSPAEPEHLQRRVLVLEQELEQLRGRVSQLQEIEDFRAQLEAGEQSD